MPNRNEKEIVRIDLTQAQKDKIKAETGKTAEAIELSLQELEARIAPRLGWTSNHNETLLVD